MDMNYSMVIKKGISYFKVERYIFLFASKKDISESIKFMKNIGALPDHLYL